MFSLKITPIFLVLSIGFGLRLCIAVWNSFYGPSFGAELDALSFHNVAVEYANDPTVSIPGIGWMYSYFLGKFYSITTDHIFLGSLLSCVVWVLSALFLLKILNLLGVNNRNKYLALLIYTFLPSSLLYTSVTLREVYQLLFVNIVIYSALMIIIRRSLLHWISLSIGVIGASILHGGLLMFGIFLTALTLFFLSINSRVSKVKFWTRVTLITPLLIAIMAFGISIFSEHSYQLDNGIINSIISFQNTGILIDARASYKTDISVSSVFEFLMFIPTSVFQYLFEPMLWKISAVVDIPIFLENILRLWLILIAIKGLRASSLGYYYPLLFILIAYFALETIWSLGTINWGTASRHHIPATGILLAAAFANRNIKIKRRQR